MAFKEGQELGRRTIVPLGGRSEEDRGRYSPDDDVEESPGRSRASNFHGDSEAEWRRGVDSILDCTLGSDLELSSDSRWPFHTFMQGYVNACRGPWPAEEVEEEGGFITVKKSSSTGMLLQRRRDFDRLPALPPTGRGKPLASKPAEVEPDRRRTTTGRGWVSPTPSVSVPPPHKSNATKEAAYRGKRAEMLTDLCDGLRVIILGADPAHVPRGTERNKLSAEDRPVHSEANREETLKVYKVYCTLLEQDQRVKREPDSSSEDEDQRSSTPAVDDPETEDSDAPGKMPSRMALAAEHGISRDLMPIAWPTFVNWAQQKHDLAGHFRYKSVVAALLRAIKNFRKLEATAEQRFFGVSLSMLFQWMWPAMSADSIVQLFTWICFFEIEKIRQPTPRIIEPQERRALETIFKAMDMEGRGYLTPEDIAGGARQDTRLRNIVDVDTVRKVCGERRISKMTFLELMCEDGSRGHEGAKKVLLETGQRLVEVAKPSIGFVGWMQEEVPEWEEAQRRLVDAVEAEVVRWSHIARSRRREPPLVLDEEPQQSDDQLGKNEFIV